MSKQLIRVLLVDDSALTLDVLTRLIGKTEDITVVGTAQSGLEALAKLQRLEVDVVCIDLLMREMNGLALTKAIMARNPKPILVISIAVNSTEDSENIFKLIDAGAIDVVQKPSLMDLDLCERTGILSKIRLVSGVSVLTRHKPHRGMTGDEIDKTTVLRFPEACDFDIVAIGASTGGPKVIYEIISKLDCNFPVPIFCTQHISKGFLQDMVRWMSNELQISIEIACNGQKIKPGTVYYCPESFNICATKYGYIMLKEQGKEQIYCPSVDLMFESVAEVYGSKCLGILLTGMGDDGAKGLMRIKEMNGMTITQDEGSCAVYGMPKAAKDMGASQNTMTPLQISEYLSMVQSKRLLRSK